MKTKDLLQIAALGLLFFFFTAPAARGQEAAMVNLSFRILDIDSGSPLDKANIFAFDENNKFVFEGKTNVIGVFTIGTKLRPGQKIRAMVQKEGYKVFTDDFEITDPRRQENTWDIKLIPKERIVDPSHPDIPPASSDFDSPLSGHIYDARANRRGRQTPLKGVGIDLMANGRRIQKGQTDDKGYFMIYHDFKAGQDITLFLDKTPEYVEKEYLYTYRDYGNVLPPIYLERYRKVPCKCWFWTGGLALAGSSYLVFYRPHQKFYDRYSSLENLDENYDSESARLDDLNKAELYKGLGLGGMAVGVAAIAGGPFLCKWLAPKTDDNSTSGARLRPGFYGYNTSGPGPGLSLVLTF